MADHDEEQPNPWSVISSGELGEILQDDNILIDTLLDQSDATMQPIAEAMLLKKNVAKSFTEFLLYFIKMFLSATEDGIITLKNSVNSQLYKN